MPSLDAEIDRLYQLPLDEFTGARNALAKTAGKRGAEIRGLRKPPAAAWAINQVFWRRRELYTALIDAARTMRAAHAAALAGKQADLRGAGRSHEAALQEVLEAALRILGEAGQPATDATKLAIATTLRALPAEEPPGRLTSTLQPGGFEVLAGMPVGAARPPAARLPARETAPPATERRPNEAKKSEAIARAKEMKAAAAKGVREAEQNVRREALEAARTEREKEKAARALEAAREALEAARQSLAGAERAHEAAARRARQADELLAAARRRARDAEDALQSPAR